MRPKNASGREIFWNKKKVGRVVNKILFHLNCLERGGAERVVSNLANQFAREGDEVIVATEWEGEAEYSLDERVRRVHVGLKESDENRSRLSKAIRRFLYLRKFILQEKPDVTVAFAKKAIYRALAATLFTKEKVIIAVRTNPVGHYDQRIDKVMIPLLLSHAAGAVFQTEGQRDFFPKYIQNKSTIILNPLHDKYISA
ncbi:MAG: glycosyltransferase, partial [Eubacterium sp.]|nr:glycosyltransferase [Eubacterium sp.]